MRQAIERSHFYTMRRANNSLMRAVLAEGINPDSYLGHGTFAVVFATGEETVAKLTVDPAVAAACSELITSEGRANQVAIAHVVKQGVAITCGEKDSFGWLTGVIHTKHGKIVFG